MTYTPDSLRALGDEIDAFGDRETGDKMRAHADAWEAQEEVLRYIVDYFDNDGLKAGCVAAERVWPAHLMERIAKGRAALEEKP